MNKYVKNFESFINLNDNQLFLYHGSGKKFDVFSNEFNGSGVGNNGYGYGIYLTDSKKSAKMWASHLETQSSVLIDGIKPSENVEEFLYRAVKLYGNKTDILLHVLKSNLDSLYKNNKITGDEYNFIKTANKLKLTRGRFVYEVEIKGDDFLLWKSLPTTEQLNKVSEQLSSEKLGVISIDKDIKVNNRMIRNGEDLYLSIGLSPKETSFFLDRCGIDGIKYYEDNCANYVIFNLNSIIIKKKVNF